MKVRFADTTNLAKPKMDRRHSTVSSTMKTKRLANTSENDDFDLWDHNRGLDDGKRSKPRVCWLPALIPILLICLLICLVIFLPLSEYRDKLFSRQKRIESNVCLSTCNIELVESIPEGLVYPDGSPKFKSTFDAWSQLIDSANHSIDIGSFYWTLLRQDVYNHSSAWQGEAIFDKLMTAGKKRKIAIRIAQNKPNAANPSGDTDILVKQNAAKVRSLDFQRLIGGGILHTKLWIVDDKHIYIGSANMDWRALTQVKELGALITNCTCLVDDISKIFNVYWDMGAKSAIVPPFWPKEYATRINDSNPISVAFNSKNFSQNVYMSSSPPPFSPKGRTGDGDAIVKIIEGAEEFIHISVMDYSPLLVFRPKIEYWSIIDDALRRAAINHRVSIKLLISYWKHSAPSIDNFLHSLQVLSHAYRNVDIQVKRFIVPTSDDQANIPFARVNHNKYMVTDKIAYIGTSNWSGDYFVDTAGIGLILENIINSSNATQRTMRDDLADIFMRDWNSPYARELVNIY